VQQMKLTLVRRYKNWWDKEARITEHVIEGPNADAVYAKCFREYFNREKYAESTSTSFKDPAHKKPYREWLSDVRNYANNGGDMW
tara:strand:+ start:63 stop:317 length:255 start_codon:yes stop_codon:yes gene_type:complete